MSLKRTLTCLAATCLAALACGASPALALQYTPHSFSSSFDGSDSTGGGWGTSVKDIAADRQTGNVYVISSPDGDIHKFNADGVATPFTDPSLNGSTVIPGPFGSSFSPEIAVDNSGGPHQGRIYLAEAFESLTAFEPSGVEVGGNFPISGPGENLAVDPTSGTFWASLFFNPIVNEHTSDGDPTGRSVRFSSWPSHADVDPTGDLYAFTNDSVTGINKLDDDTGDILYTLPFSVNGLAVDQVGGNLFGIRSGDALEFGPSGDMLPGFTFTGNPVSVAVNGQNGNVYVAFNGEVRIFKPQAQVTLPDAETTPPTNITASGATLNASVNPVGVDTSSCQFEFGPTVSYGTTAPCTEGQVLSGYSAIAVSADISGLTQGSTYHYRLVVGNANGAVKTLDATVSPSAPPTVGNVYVDSVHSDSARVHAWINPGGAPTTYHVEYGPEDCLANPGACASTPETSSIGAGLKRVDVNMVLGGLAPNTTYHYVVVATNQSDTVKSDDRTFTTFPSESFVDNCANAHVRQQTGAALLPDCRAYELVSAANSGGYDVESYLTSGQTPFGGYPRATSPSRVLYGVHEGAIPGTNHPTNHGLDPYVAIRGADGWSTSYVGIPANLLPDSFASPLLAADASLDTFAFGGEDLCSPCFADGSTGVPVRLPDGGLAQGMTGPANPAPATGPELLVSEPLSADGSHLVFGSSAEFVSGAGSPAIYARNLLTGTTTDISRLPNGDPIPCLINCTSDGLAELDISADGSRIVIGQLLDVDAAGNRYWHLYMNVGAADHTIDLMPGAGASAGALYSGMSADGTIVYLTSRAQLDGDDTDSSADIYRADVAPAGADLTLISAGSGAGNTDACTPVGNSVNTRWNALDGAPSDCSAVAIGGGGGVAAGSGAIYFLSPELLDGPGNGTADAPNLYRAQPGSAPSFVVTLESSLTGPAQPLTIHPFDHSFGAGETPQFIAVDSSGGPSDGAVYVADNSEHEVRKFDSAGNPITSWGDNGVLDGSTTAGLGSFPLISGLAVGSDGTLYVATYIPNTGTKDLFEFNEDGTFATERNMTGLIGPVGVAVDSADNLYYVDETDGFQGAKESQVRRYASGGANTAISTNVLDSGHKSGLSTDPISGDLYVNYGADRIGRFSFDGSDRVFQPDGSICDSECVPTVFVGLGAVFGAEGTAVDPTNGDLYVDEGNKILRFDSDGQRVRGPDTGGEVLSNSTSVAIGPDTTLYANNATSSGAQVAVFSALVPGPDPRTDNPAIVGAVNDAGIARTADFQVTPSGDEVAFSTTIPFSGADSDGHANLFRYDATAGDLTCVSCNPTNARAGGDAELAANGLSLTDDGRVFFTTIEPLAARDLDNRKDVYEWEPGVGANLISTGISQFDSILLSASADGTDAHFFTRDSLVPQDQNGPLVKIYDARAGGGFPYVPPPVPCKASDECHGAGTQRPAPANVNSAAGASGNFSAPLRKQGRCKRGFVKRRGKCVKKRHGKRAGCKRGSAKRRSAKRQRRCAKRGKRRGTRRQTRNKRQEKRNSRYNGRRGDR